MTRHAGETWLFRVELPPGVRHGDRFVARILKHLLRAWGVRCVAVLEAPEEPLNQEVRHGKTIAVP
jgi:hypothetical protein